jgi:two-component system response regulator AtoC
MKNKYRILVVDDEENTRLALSKILTKWNYEVLIAENGEDALNVFNKASFDLVITDKKMPGMNGIDLLTKVRKISPDVGVIIITAFGEVDLY